MVALTKLDTNLVGVPRDQLSKTIWDMVEPILETAVDRSNGRYRTDDVLNAVREGKQQLWIVLDGRDNITATVTTEIRGYPGGRNVCNVRMCAGHGYKAWVHHLKELETWAKEQGCDMVEIMGRTGWTPELSKMGYRQTQAVFEAEI